MHPPLATSTTTDAQPLPYLLRIPLELRLQIYEHAILSPRSITIAGTPGYWDRGGKSGHRHVQGSDGQMAGQQVWVAEGLSEDLLVPLEAGEVERGWGKGCRWRAGMHGCECEAEEECGGGTVECGMKRHGVAVDGNELSSAPACSKGDTGLLRSPVESLYLTCRQTHDELTENFPHIDNYHRTTDLYVSYPAGVTVLADHYSDILKRARTVTILGISTLDDDTGLQLERVQGMHNYVFENVDIAPGATLYSHISSEDMLARHQINSLALVIARLLGRAAFEEEQEYRDRQAARHRAMEMEAPLERRLSFSSIPRENTPPSLLACTTSDDPNSTTPSPLLDDTPQPHPQQTLTIDPPPAPNPRKPNTPPGSPLPSSPTLNLRIFHPRRPSTAQSPPALNLNPNHNPFTSPIHYNTTTRPRYFHHQQQQHQTQMQQDPYTQIWSHVFSPITIAMSNIYGGHIALSVARGQEGVGVAAVVRGNAGMGRQVESRWPVLGGGNAGGAESKGVGGEGRAWLVEGWKGRDEGAVR